MSKPKKRLDTRQLNIFDYDARIDEYVALKTEILTKPEKAVKAVHSWEESCIEVAANAKKSIKSSGMSRDQAVDAINEYFGWTTPTGPRHKGSKGISLAMFNNYLSKPVEYPMPAWLIYGIQHVTASLIICKGFAEAEDAKVASGEEVREFALGKIDSNITELQRLKKELRGR